MIRLLHISDIHFKAPYCLDERIDRDSRIRDLIMRDAKDFVTKTDIPVSAILVTGDIAFKASPEEFSKASEWLKKLAKEVGADLENVYVVPGNHDVNRGTGDKFNVKAVRNEILSSNGEARVGTFLNALQDQDASNALMEPFSAYNEFSAQYECSISPNKPFWQNSIPFCPRYKLILNGLTSTFFSGSNDAKPNLYMGEFQANLNISDGEINLAMFHHPYDWLEDGDKVEDYLTNRSQIRLVGHKHRQRAVSDHNGVLFSAAAANPERNEQGYEPGYNILDLSISENDDSALLSISAHLRVLQNMPEIFLPKMKTATKDVWEYEFEIPLSKIKVEEIPPLRIDKAEVKDKIDEAPLAQDGTHRSLVYRFWNIAESARRDIIGQLNLLAGDEKALHRLDKYEIALENVVIFELKDKFIELIEAAEGLK